MKWTHQLSLSSSTPHDYHRRTDPSYGLDLATVMRRRRRKRCRSSQRAVLWDLVVSVGWWFLRPRWGWWLETLRRSMKRKWRRRGLQSSLGVYGCVTCATGWGGVGSVVVARVGREERRWFFLFLLFFYFLSL